MDKRECEVVVQNMRSCLPHSEPIVAKNGMFGMSEFEDTPPSSIKPAHADSAFLLTSQIHVPNVPNVAITDEERRLIIEQRNRQLLESGKVVRTKIKKALGWNSDGYEKIKIVCDELGWHKGMSVQKISTEGKQAMKQEAGVCAKCGSTDNLEIDHKWPQSFGGNSEPENLQVLCKPCNQKKGASV